MYQNIVATDSLPWTPLDYEGVSIRVMHEDSRTGGITVLTRMDPGSVIPAHFHTLADETVFVVSGDFIEDEKSHGAGSFFTGAAGTPHGPHQTRTGCVLLTTFSATLDFRLV